MVGIKIWLFDKLQYKRMDILLFFVSESLVVGIPTLTKAFDYSTNKKIKNNNNKTIWL